MPAAPASPESASDTAHRAAELQSALDITNALLSAISSDDPVRALVSRIGILCRGTAVIYNFEGAVIASTGEAPTQLIWNEVSATNRQELTLEIGRWHARTRRVALREGVHVIAIASRGTETLDQFGELLLDTSERMLSAVFGIRHGATLRDRRDNEQLLGSLHDGILPSREHRFWARLTQFHFTAYTQLRALELTPIDTRSADETHVASLLTSARAEEVPLLVTLRRAEPELPATVAALVPDTPYSERWVDRLSADMLIGVSDPFTALAQVPAAVREAETALGIIRNWAAVISRPEQIGPVRIDRIDLSTWLLSHVDQRQLQQHVERTLAPLRNAALLDTLVTYLAAEQNIALTAKALFIHTNTVRYRLSRIEEILGVSIGAAPAIANLSLALQPQILGRSEDLRS